MKGALRAIVLGSLLATEQCSEPNAPVAGPPAIVSPAARIAFVTELPEGSEVLYTWPMPTVPACGGSPEDRRTTAGPIGPPTVAVL